VRSILAVGAGALASAQPGQPLTLELPAVPTRPLAAYALDGLQATPLERLW
jgi:hypothetical protein